jgi:Uma2 family endonuclease
MPTNEIVLPITKPETEWIRGRAVQKVSPKRDHSRVQGQFLLALSEWSRGRGEVGPEWRFRIAVAGEPRRPLVPDIAFVSYERLRGFSHDEIQAPMFAPNVAIEVFSPGDKRLDIASKIDVYLRAGCELVIVAYPKTRTMTLHDASSTTSLAADDSLRHAALPGFELPLRAFFADALDIPV